MKTFSALLISLFIVLQSFAGDWTNIRSGQPVPGQKQLVSSSIDQSIIHFTVDGFFTSQVITPQGPAMVISLENATQNIIAMDNVSPNVIITQIILTIII